MAAPVATVRQVPDGFMLKNGYQSLVTFSLFPDLFLWEKNVTPPGLSMGEKIDQTTQHNRRVRTAAARKLIEVKDGKFTCAYDTGMYALLDSIVGVEQTITQQFPDQTTIAYFGYMSDFEPSDLEEGKQPEATITIHATNRDPDVALFLAKRQGREGFPELFGGGTGTAFLVNEQPPVWSGG